ncbi:MAG: hypothetical protein JWN23_973 [Rhodocyclales bacterium]|nr:hypothetical protein [Rhodocyclales bacterium]
MCTEKFDLLQTCCEPTDEQLAQLMREVAAAARERAELANRALMATIAKETAKVRLRYGLSYFPRTGS